MQVSWYNVERSYYAISGTSITGALPVGIYKLINNKGNFSLELVEQAFSLPGTIYGMDRAFIDHAKRSWEAATANLGILLTGIKGGGKTMTCKQLANEVQLPVILVDVNHGPGMVSYLSGLSQELCILCDEYEKVFAGNKEEYDDAKEDSTMLTLMDGSLGSAHKLLFLLTTNSLDINENMLQRPGRVRYVRRYKNLSKEVIEEIVDDMLLWPDLRAETVAFLSKLAIITVDIVTSILREVNIHQQDPEAFASFFNVAKQKDLHNIILVKDDGEEVCLAAAQEVWNADKLEQYGDLRTARTVYGNVTEPLIDGECRIEVSASTKKRFKQLAGLDEATIRLEPVMGYNVAYANAF